MEDPKSVEGWQFIQDLLYKDHSTVTPDLNQEMAGYQRWATPFVVFGTNALVLYFLSTLCALLLGIIRIPQPGGVSLALHAVLYRRLFMPWTSPINGSLAWAIAYLMIWLGAMWLLYRRRIFIRV